MKQAWAMAVTDRMFVTPLPPHYYDFKRQFQWKIGSVDKGRLELIKKSDV